MGSVCVRWGYGLSGAKQVCWECSTILGVVTRRRAFFLAIFCCPASKQVPYRGADQCADAEPLLPSVMAAAKDAPTLPVRLSPAVQKCRQHFAFAADGDKTHESMQVSRLRCSSGHSRRQLSQGLARGMLVGMHRPHRFAAFCMLWIRSRWQTLPAVMQARVCCVSELRGQGVFTWRAWTCATAWLGPK